MKTSQFTGLLLYIFICSCLIMNLTSNQYKDLKQNSKVNLPEEYKLITKDTPIKGYMNKDSILVIEFVHK